MKPFYSLSLLLASSIGEFATASSSKSSKTSKSSSSSSSSSDNTIAYRAFGSAVGDSTDCYTFPYFDEAGEEELGTAVDCVTSEVVPDETFTVFQFQITTTFTPADDDEDAITTQCVVTVSPLPGGVDEEGFNAMEECFNEEGVLTGPGGSVELNGLVDNTQLFITGTLTFDLLWTITLNDSSEDSLF